MSHALRHRGPDGEGFLVAGPAGLAHRRLAIVDVEGGRQPMSNEDGTVWVILNGEIYNHASLRPELERCGHRYATRSDTETIVHAYEEYGAACLEKLDGMFAIAIWDAPRRTLLLARDRLGIKPLYYAATGREVVFASEIKAILASGAVRPRLREDVVSEFLATRFVAGEETLFRGIRRLAPGAAVMWSPTGCEERTYWSLPSEASGEPPTGGFAGAADEVRTRLTEAVRSHLMSDVPLGLFLSGGIDSSGLLGLMAPLVRPEPVRTFAVGFRDRDANELHYARAAAERAGAEHREIVVSPEEFFAELPRLVWHEDEPIAFPSSVPLYFVSRLARDHVKVVLTGEGADELFLGYNRYRVTAWNERLGGAWSRVPDGMRGGVRRLVGGLPASVRRYAGRSFLALPAGPRALFYDNFAVFPEALHRRLLADPGLLVRDPYAKGLGRYASGGGDALDRMSRADLQTYLVRLLMKQDRMSMAASIESRVPFLDHHFVEHALALPSGYKLRGFETKAVLRAALRDVVPPAILTRRKMGFPVPVGRWLRGPFWPLVRDLVLGPRALARGLFKGSVVQRLAEEHRRGADHGDRLWLLLNLEIWQRLFVDGEDAASVLKAA